MHNSAEGYRRQSPLFVEYGERQWLDPAAFFAGRIEIGTQPVVRVWAPPANAPLELSPLETWLLACLPSHCLAPLPTLVGEDAVGVREAAERLCANGLLLTTPCEAGSLQFSEWWAPAALYHFSSRWHRVLARDEVPTNAESAQQAVERSKVDFERHADLFGKPPGPCARWGDDNAVVDLPPAGSDDGLAGLLLSRETHRLFDTSRPLPLALAARLLAQALGVNGSVPLGGGLVALRKGVPSGGGMHPTEACVLALDVEGLACGWYHYRADQHRLALICQLDRDLARERVTQYTAGQRYFATAPLCIALVLRFPRHHWKYPQHAKALRVMLLEAGHIGQSIYLSATELGLGAFFTAAINEVELDEDLGFDGVNAGSIALLGAGWPVPEGSALRLSHYQSQLRP